MAAIEPVRPLRGRVEALVTFKDPKEDNFVIEGDVQFASEEEKAHVVGQTIGMIRAVGGVVKTIENGAQYRFIPFSEVKSIDLNIITSAVVLP